MRRFLKTVVHRRRSSRNRDPDTGVAETALPTRSEQPGLWLLSNGLSKEVDIDTESFEVDVVAIHGLNGHAYGTWTHKITESLWLRDLLPEDLPGARIYTYSYPSHVLFSTSKATISDYAQSLLVSLSAARVGQERRPIIFIAHSLGGIVLKQALVSAKFDPNYSPLLNNTRAILFFGTPHRGARGTPGVGIFLGDVLDVCTRATGTRLFAGKTRGDLLRNLEANSPDLREITAKFRHVLGEIDVVTYYETEEKRPLGRLIVDQDSAIMGITREKVTPMYANHTDMCRFTGRADRNYEMVASEIQQLCRKANIPYQALRESDKARVRLFNEVDVKEYRSTLPKRVDGTCNWVLKSPQYESWMEEGEATLLWITGHAGSGKTILSSYITEQLAAKVLSTKMDPLVCFFFCNDGIRNQRDAKAILRSIIFQILMERRDLIGHVKTLLDYDEGGSHLLNSYERLWSLFTSIASDAKLGPISIIIDALDECEKDSRGRLLDSIAKLIDDLRTMASRCVRFLITSRPYLTITDCFTKYQPYRLPLEEKQNEIDADIRLVIEQRVERIAQRTKAKQDTIALLERSLNDNADRTFLWAKFALDILDEELLSAPKDFQRILAELPRDLEQTYERFLRKIQSGKERFAINLLHLILASYRPPSLDEITIIVAMQEATEAGCHNLATLDKEYIRTNMRADINKVLGPLVRISDSKVYLVHISLKEFLCTSICDLEDKRLSAKYRMDMHQAHKFLASACMQYLALDEFAEDLFTKHRSSLSDGSLPSSSPESEEQDTQSVDNLPIFGNLLQEPEEIDAGICAVIAQRYGLFAYSALHWTRHYAESQYSAPTSLQDLALRLSDKVKQYQFTNWFRFFWFDSMPSTNASFPDFDALIVASFFDHVTSLNLILTQRLLEKGESLGNALYWASRNGNTISVVRLLQTEIDPNLNTVYRKSALSIAAELGHTDVVKVLVEDSRVDVNVEDQYRETPLTSAASNGHNEIIAILLKHESIEVNIANFRGRTPFMWAVIGSHLNVTRLLASDARVDVNKPDKLGRSTFSWAAEKGDESIVATLLKHAEIDVHRPDNTGCTPLYWAAGKGRTGVIKQQKRSKGLDISHSHKDRTGRSAIGWAAWGGHDATIKLLIKYGLPGVDEEDESQWTPLFWALEAPTSSTVATLISTGMVNVNHRDHSGRTALFWIAGYGKEDFMRVLLAAEGIDARSTDNEGQIPLDWARKLEKQGTARMLEEFMQ